MRMIFLPTDESKEISDIVTRAHDNDAGYDVILQNDVTLNPGRNKIPLGFRLILPVGVAGFIFPRSSYMGDSDIHFDTAPIDPDYSGEWHLLLSYSGEDPLVIKAGSRICQIVLIPVVYPEFVKSFTKIRSDNGIGSSGN